MIKVTFIDWQGAAREVNAQPGDTLMTAALANHIPGIRGECGGAMACGTCQVEVAPEWLTSVGLASGLELDLLAVSTQVGAGSRLGCQVKLGLQQDGMVVHTPEQQGV